MPTRSRKRSKSPPRNKRSSPRRFAGRRSNRRSQRRFRGNGNATYCTWNRDNFLATKDYIKLYDASQDKYDTVENIKSIYKIQKFIDFGGGDIKKLKQGDESVIENDKNNFVLTGGATREANAKLFQGLYPRKRFFAIPISDEADLTWESCRDAVLENIKERPLAMVAFGSTDSHAQLVRTINETTELKDVPSVQINEPGHLKFFCDMIAFYKPAAILLAGSSVYKFDLDGIDGFGVKHVPDPITRLKNKAKSTHELMLINACQTKNQDVKIYVNIRKR